MFEKFMSKPFIPFPLTSAQYIKSVTEKKQIYLHHTAGAASAINVAKFWSGNQDRIATSYVIGGKFANSINQNDGDIVELFDSNYWAYHLGVRRRVFESRKIQYQVLDRISIGIEICCWGQLTRDGDGTFKNYVGSIIPEEEVIELEKPFKGHIFWHNYTDAQISSAKYVLEYLCKKHNISTDFNDDIFGVTDRALRGDNGIFTHNSVRSDKVDVYPHPKLIEALKNLNK